MLCQHNEEKKQYVLFEMAAENEKSKISLAAQICL